MPKSLFGRMLLVLIIGLLLALGLSTAIFLHERQKTLSRIIWTQAAQKIATDVRVLEAVPSADRRNFMDILSRDTLLVSFDNTVATVETAPPLLSEILQSQLGEKKSMKIVWLGDDNVFFGASFGVRVKLADGQWMVFNYHHPNRGRLWTLQLQDNLLILSLALALLSFLAVRWVTGPLKLLANAADELGSNLYRAKLPESGPTEVSMAARAFNSMQARLIQHMEEKTNMLVALSHDLKTPITRMRLRAEFMEENDIKSKCIADLEQIDSMVSRSLDLIQGNEKKERIQQVDVMSLLESIQEDQFEMGRVVTLEGKAEKNCPAKLQAFKCAVNHLVENAVKYGKKAMIHVEEATGFLNIYVRDEGPGMPESEMKKVFEPYYRIENSRSRETGGAGLGLAIVKSVVNDHGGSMELRNRPEGGLEAKLSLPLA